MKKYYSPLLLFCCCIAMAQNPDKIVFTYDTAGNQVQRELCINCTNPNAKYVSNPKMLKKEELIPSEASDLVSYYPNPVKEELYLKWELALTNPVTTIQVYDLNGRTLKSFTQTNKDTSCTIPFLSYPVGMYLIIFNYTNGEQKKIKIVKQ
ncbi:T9SS type A sorting domain-containing protein [Flavobacterium restrictum]|nr:T9SS type A sorting domain-containing protein [Flavobacterium restrictum]